MSSKKSMKVFSPDKSELMSITSIQRDGNDLVVSGKIMGSMPMKAVLRPEEARRAITLLNLKTVLFILTLLFRKATSKPKAK